MKRDRALDVLKGVGIILVVFSHLTYNGQISRTLVQAFIMPLFFMASGQLYKQKTIKENVVRGGRRYLLPAYLFLAIDLLILVATGKIVSILNAKSLLATFGLMGGGMMNAPIWFLPAIFSTIIIFSLIKNKKARIIISILCALVGGFIHIDTGLYLWPLVVLEMLPLYAFAYYAKVLAPRHNFDPLLFISETILFLALALLNGYTSLIQQIFGLSYYLFLITGILGTHVLYQVCSYICGRTKTETLSFIGRHTMVILLTHYLICRRAIPKLFSMIDQEQMLHMLFVQILITIALIAVYYSALKMFAWRKKSSPSPSRR